MAENKKHHFVPQFYMRNFSADAERKRVSLYVIDTATHVPAAKIKDQACENYFYGKGGVEEALGKLETAASPVIAKAIASNVLPEQSSDGHFSLLTFVLFQEARTPTMAADINEMTEKMVRTVAKGFPDLQDEADKITVNDRNTPVMALRVAEERRPFILDLRWKLLENKTDHLFITSDNPVVRYNQFLEKHKPLLSNTGWACKGLQIFLPLGPRHLLMLYDGDVYRVGGSKHRETRVENTGKWDIEALNALQAANAEEVLYFHSDTKIEHVRDAVKQAQRFRRDERIDVSKCNGIDPNGKKGNLIIISRREARTGLVLNCVGIIPSAAGAHLDNHLAQFRNPELIRRFEETRVRGRYDARGLVDHFRSS